MIGKDTTYLSKEKPTKKILQLKIFAPKYKGTQLCKRNTAIAKITY